MSISLGLMLRIDSFPPAVAIPPLPQGLQSLRPVIEAEKIIEPTSIRQSKPFSRNSSASYDYNASSPAQSQLLTYARDGAAGVAMRPVSGQLLNIYA